MTGAESVKMLNCFKYNKLRIISMHIKNKFLTFSEREKLSPVGGDFIKRDTGLDAGRREVTGVKPPNILRAGTDRDDDDILGPMSSLCHVSPCVTQYLICSQLLFRFC